jgi:hypothetical protein
MVLRPPDGGHGGSTIALANPIHIRAVDGFARNTALQPVDSRHSRYGTSIGEKTLRHL